MTTLGTNFCVWNECGKQWLQHHAQRSFDKSVNQVLLSPKNRALFFGDFFALYTKSDCTRAKRFPSACRQNAYIRCLATRSKSFPVRDQLRRTAKLSAYINYACTSIVFVFLYVFSCEYNSSSDQGLTKRILCPGHSQNLVPSYSKLTLYIHTY